MIPRFHPSPNSLPSVRNHRLHRCFGTTVDGRIPITPDWPRLITCLAALPQVALQTRHSYGRLVALAPLPDGDPATGELHQSFATSLRFNYAHWHDAWARIAVCDCCDSPGRIEVINAQGAEFLQICAPAHMPPEDWASIIAPFVGRSPGDLAAIPDATNAPPYAVPVLKPDARRLALSPSGLPRLLQAVTAGGHAFATNLCTASASQTRITCPDQVTFDGQQMCFTDRGTTLQLIVPQQTHLHTENTEQGRWLHLTTADGSILLSFGPGTSAGPAHEAWEAALDDVGPV